MVASPSARTHYGLTFTVLAVSTASYSMMQSLVAPALPEIQHELGVSSAAVAWVLTAYLVSASVMTPILGRLGDMFGKERLLVFSLILLAAGSIISAVADGLAVMLVGRVLQGAAGALFPLAYGIIRDEFPRQRMAFGIGAISALLGVGGGLGTVLAGPIVDGLGYHWIFWLPLVPTVASLAAAVAWVPESPVKTPGRVDWIGGMLLSCWLITTLVAVTQGPSWGWDDPRVLGLFAVGALTLWLWITCERRIPDPLVDMRMMRIRPVWTVNATAFLIGGGMYSSFVLIPQFVETPAAQGYGFGASVTQAGLFMLPSTAGMLLAGTVAGRLCDRLGGRVILLGGCASITASYVLLTAAHDGRLEIYLASGLLGLGVGMAFASMANLIVAAVPPSQTGVATGMNNVLRTVGGAVGTTIGGSIVTASVVGAAAPTEHGFTVAFAASLATSFAAVLVALLVPTRRRGEAILAEGAPA